MGDDTFLKMVWKRKFLYLVCVGSVVACMIFITNRDETIGFNGGHFQSSRYVMGSATRVEAPNFQHTVSGNQNNEDRFHHSLLPAVRLSHTNLPTFNQSSINPEALIRIFSNSSSKASDLNRRVFSNSSFVNSEVTDQGRLSTSEIFYKSKNRTLLSLVLGDSNNASRSILSDHYNRVFQWDDRDPEGWRGLPLSKGEITLKTNRIIFNRVGKCGSRTVIAMLRDLAQQNRFNLISSTVYNQTNVPKHHEKHIVSILDQVQPPYLFQRHIHYVSFKRHEAQEVVYINIIREPIARMVSQYYFARYGDGRLGHARARMWNRPQEEFHETIDECVKYEHRDCSGHRTFYIIPFFCGNSKRCTTPSRWALHRAMYNVQHNFLVVGILEEFDLTLRILERVLPNFFSGAMEVYQTANMAENITNTSTTFKIPPSNETVAILKERMYYEYRFYNFVKERLYQQKAHLGM